MEQNNLFSYKMKSDVSSYLHEVKDHLKNYVGGMKYDKAQW